ncbi:MAG: hypothetical protein IJ716_11595 [Lachnospiraceae bacterium]|nr:hypothetical protein [Lachnospiraceae bacterium]
MEPMSKEHSTYIRSLVSKSDNEIIAEYDREKDCLKTNALLYEMAMRFKDDVKGITRIGK